MYMFFKFSLKGSELQTMNATCLAPKSWSLVPFPMKQEPALFRKMTGSKTGVQISLEQLMTKKGIIVINNGTYNKHKSCSC